MRRTLYAVLAVALIAGMTVSAQAGTTLQWNITVTFNADSINLTTTSPNTLTWGTVGPNQDVLSNQAQGQNRISVANIGYSRIDYTVTADCATGWTLGGTLNTNPDNTPVLCGIFTAPVLDGEQPEPYGRTLLVADFAQNDVLAAGVLTQASATVLARDDNAGDDDPVYMKGYNVPQNIGETTERSLRFMLQTPDSVSGGGVGAQMIDVTLGGVAVAW